MRRSLLPVLCLLTALPLYAEVPHVEVATWNLEWFNQGERGFPENTRGGPTYGPRDARGLETIAYLVRKHGMDVIGLQEIENSADLRQLLAYLPGYEVYIVPESASQHCALLWDTAVAGVQLQPPVATLALTSGQRQGLHAWIRSGDFTFDFLVVHLANDDGKVAQQVRMLRDWVNGTLGDSPRQDDDAIIGGDLNLTPKEAPLRALLAEPLLAWCFAGITPLPPTRAPSGKTIDHLFMTRDCYDYQRLGDAWVPREDLQFGERYRELVSDHLPVIQSFRTDRD